MIVIIGLVIMLIAGGVAIVGVMSNTGPEHALTEDFTVFGYHVTGSTGTLFLSGIVVGAVALLGLSVLLAGARHTAARGRAARRELSRTQHEMDFVNRDRATLIDSQDNGPGHDSTPDNGARVGLLDRWQRHRQPAGTLRHNQTGTRRR